jgi:hypothetical protein
VVVNPPPPATPTGLWVMSNAEPGATFCSAGWNAASGATSYDLMEGASVVYSSPNTSYSRDTACYETFQVRACNTGGCSAWSAGVRP